MARVARLAFAPWPERSRRVQPFGRATGLVALVVYQWLRPVVDRPAAAVTALH